MPQLAEVIALARQIKAAGDIAQIKHIAGRIARGDCADTVRNDADHWITVNSGHGEGGGTPALIGEDGTVKAGMGGKFNGKNIKDAHGTEKFTSGETNKETEARHKSESADEPVTVSKPTGEQHKEFNIPKPELTPAEKAGKHADELSATAKTAQEHTEARNAHAQAANQLGQKHPDWVKHYDQHKVHELAAKAAVRAEAKAGGGHIGQSREKEFAKATPDEIGKRLTDKFGLNFSNGANTQAAEKEAKNAWKEYLSVRGESAEVKNAARDKYDAAKRKEYEANRKHPVKSVTTYDINDTSSGAKNARKTIAAVDASLDSMVKRGFDIKSAIGSAKVSFVPGTCDKYGGMAWGGSQGNGHFTISHDKCINPVFVAEQKAAQKRRAEKGLPNFLSWIPGDDPADHTVRHELAHALGMQPHINSPAKLTALLRDMHGDDKKASNEWVKKNISEYATENIHETDAELCAMVTSPNYVKGALPPEFEKHVHDLFKYKEA